MERLYKPLRFRRERLRQNLEECSLIGGGSVRLLLLSLVFCHSTPSALWIGNTRVISQTALDHFRTSLAAKKDDPYSVLLRRNKLPMALLDDAANPNLRKVCGLKRFVISIILTMLV